MVAGPRFEWTTGRARSSGRTRRPAEPSLRKAGLGFQLTIPERKLGPGPRALGHFGAGGSLGFADPDAHVAIGYAMNQRRAGWQHKHVRQLIDLVYAAL